MQTSYQIFLRSNLLFLFKAVVQKQTFYTSKMNNDAINVQVQVHIDI